MVNTNHIRSLSDPELLRRLSLLLSQSRRVEAELVAHIGEVDRRELFLSQACSSMYIYCIEVLRLSEAEAYLRIAVARTARRFPVILQMLSEGRLHLS
ncbi:MAG TPA: HNH endonuclease, partial [Vicinamibacteria bacterium]|nr:HNH endonuclease [Vicinamibacteria bacterium]